ncbi:unnamed protein product [Clonostachys chloroleuca]|uniref:Uncharacterized protein n=1 Tax=Clonostachys chloroleuca TaxID=1926264 RepID=A0AA35VA98_9HYPO|nr:unnamed protein product [Clonostachys chloroleuca]
MSRGRKSLKPALRPTSMIQQRPKSRTMTAVMLSLNSSLKGTSFICSLISGMSSMAQAKARPDTPIMPQNGLAEGSALVVDGKGGDLLNQLQEVDTRVQQRWGKLGLKINVGGSSGERVSHVHTFKTASDVDESHDVDGKLPKDGPNDVDVEDVGLGTLLAQTLDDTGTRDVEEADRHEDTADGVLGVTELDTLQVEDGQRVGTDETVESENLVHLNGSDESAAALANDVGDSNDIAQLRREWGSDGSVTKFQGRWLVISQIRLHHGCELVSETGSLVDVLLLASVELILGGGGVGVGWARGVQVGDNDGYGRGGLVETSHQVTLLLVHFLHLGVSGVLGDLGQVIRCSVEEGNTDVSLLEGTDIVCTITSHERVISHITKSQKNIFLLLRRDTSIYPGVSENGVPSWLTLEFSESISGDANVFFLQDLGVNGLGWVNRDLNGIVDAPPDKLVSTVIVLRSVENKDITINNLNFAGDVDGGQRVISCDHDNTMAALVEHLNSLLSVILERAVQNQKAGECQVSLDLFTLEVIDLAGSELRVCCELLVGQGQYTGPLASKVLERLLVVGGDIDQHLHDRLGGTLDTSECSLDLLASLCVDTVDHGNRALSLEGGGELEATLDVNCSLNTGSLDCAVKSVILAERPAERSESCLFHRSNQCVGCSQDELSFESCVLDGDHVRVGTVGFSLVVKFWVTETKSGDTLNNQVFAGQGSSLVKAGDVDASSEGDTERLSAEDSILGEGCQASVDCEVQLHGQLRRNDTGDDQNAVEEQLGSLAVLADTLVPDVPRSSDGEYQEEQNEEQGFEISGSNTLRGIDHGSHKAALGCFKTGLDHNSHCTIVGRSRNTGGTLGLFLLSVGMGDLENLGASPEERVLVQSFGIERGIFGAELNRLLEQRRTLSREHSFVHNGSAFNQKHIASDTAVLLGTADRNQVARQEFVALDLDPLAQAEHPQVIRLDAHPSELNQSALALPHDCTFEHDQHEESEERVVPILIKHPQANAEHLEDEERGDGVFLEELGEGRHGDVEGVDAVVLFNARQFDLGVDTPGGLKVANRRLGLGIDGVLQGREDLGLRVV